MSAWATLDLLPPEPEHAYHLTPHAASQAAAKGWSEADVLAAADDPDLVTENRRYPGQRRHVRGDLVAVVDPAEHTVVTVYLNVTRTPLRPDQVAGNAGA
jgi:hypothetical protein